MGDCPPKSKGDILHLADANAETESGTLSLDGKLGIITLKDLRAYIRGKHSGKNPPVPSYITVRMHAGKGNEGYWSGEEAMMHFELILDIFDLLFNMPWVADVTKATANDLLAVTNEQRAVFKYGLCVQIDRSQNHLRRPPDALYAHTSGPTMNLKPGGAQPHLRSTRAPLPAGYTHWAQCRQRLCTPQCDICEAAAKKHGHHADFQSCGKKGTNLLLKEMGLSTAGNLPDHKKRLDEQPNWNQKQSQVIELFHDRYSTCLIGAAYHAELASEEHRWRRLKQGVRSWVNGEMATVIGLVEHYWPALDGTTTFQDNRSCRETKHAYLALESANEEVSMKALNAEYLKRKSNHRGVYDSQKCQLMCLLEMPVDDKQKKIAATVQERVRLQKAREKSDEAHRKKREGLIRSERNRKVSRSKAGQAAARVRHTKYKKENPDKKHCGGKRAKKAKLK